MYTSETGKAMLRGERDVMERIARREARVYELTGSVRALNRSFEFGRKAHELTVKYEL